jgi:hypothetical protein
MFGPYYRADPPDVIDQVVKSGELWGRPPRNFNASDFPKAKAYLGALPKGVVGFEFETEVAPDAGGVPDKPTWSQAKKKRPGVVVEGDYAKIKVKVRKVQLS